MELAHRRRTGLALPADSAEHVIATLTARGFTHLLLCPPMPADAVEFDPTLSNHLAGWRAEHRPIYRATLTDGDGVCRDYALYELPVAVALSAGGPRRVLR
jgi:hypothetical protein